MHIRHDGIVRTWQIKVEKHYVVVFEWESKEKMHQIVKYTELPYEALAHFGDTVGLISKSGTYKVILPKKIGEIHMARDNYGVATAQHELQHILGYYCRAKALTLEIHDERIAKIAGRMAGGFWKGYYKDGYEIKTWHRIEPEGQ